MNEFSGVNCFSDAIALMAIYYRGKPPSENKASYY